MYLILKQLYDIPTRKHTYSIIEEIDGSDNPHLTTNGISLIENGGYMFIGDSCYIIDSEKLTGLDIFNDCVNNHFIYKRDKLIEQL